MAKIIFDNPDLQFEPSKKSSVSTSTGFISDRDLLKKRSQKYLQAIASLDHGSLTETRGKEALMKAVAEEFGTADLANFLLGIVAKCHLGAEYEVHTLDLAGNQILQHFKFGEAMEPAFEPARPLARHNAYAFVEVYKDKVILIREDGSAAKL